MPLKQASQVQKGGTPPSSQQTSTRCDGAARRKSALRGLDRIFSMAQSDDNFTLFGNDILQCLHDVATIDSDPVRARALMYVEQLAQRWKTTVTHVGWVQGERARPQDVLNAVVSFFCLERVGIHHVPEIKAEVRAAASSYSVRDYLGFDPAVESPPRRAEDRSTGEVMSSYRALTSAIVNTVCADRVGISLGCTQETVFRWLPTLRPYLGPKDLPWREYVDQCSLVAHVVLCLNNWGELRLDPELLPHEYLFIREHLAVQITHRDVHLVGQFVDALRCFGAADSNPLVQAGVTFLLEAQEEDGSWDRGEDRDDYTTYHATMVGVKALLKHNFRGFGPCNPSLAALLGQWYEVEKSRAGLGPLPVWDNRYSHMDLAMARFNIAAGISSTSQTLSLTPLSITAEIVVQIGAKLDEARRRRDWDEALSLLEDLQCRKDIGLRVIQATAIGHTVKKCRKSRNALVSSKAQALIAYWREIVSEETSQAGR